MKKNCQIVGRQDLIRVQPRRQSYKFFRWGFLFQCFPIKHGVETSWAHILFISFSWFEILNQKKDHVLFLNSFIFPQNSKFSVKLLLRLSQNVNKLIKSAYSAQLAGDDKAARWSGLSNVQGRRNLRVKEVIPQILIDKLTLKFNPNREGGGQIITCLLRIFRPSYGPEACSLCWVPGWSYLSNLTASRRQLQSVKFKRSEIKCKFEFGVQKGLE